MWNVWSASSTCVRWCVCRPYFWKQCNVAICSLVQPESNLVRSRSSCCAHRIRPGPPKILAVAGGPAGPGLSGSNTGRVSKEETTPASYYVAGYPQLLICMCSFSSRHDAALGSQCSARCYDQMLVCAGSRSEESINVLQTASHIVQHYNACIPSALVKYRNAPPLTSSGRALRVLFFSRPAKPAVRQVRLTQLQKQTTVRHLLIQ